MSADPTPAELADLHRDSRDRVLAIVRALDDDQANAAVPGTPLWNVRELMSHIVGCPLALVAGEFDGAGSEPWTQAQVEARRDSTLVELIVELEGATASIDDGFLAGSLPSPAVYDLLTHEQDLRGAVGSPRVNDQRAIRFVVDAFAGRAVAVSAKAGLAPLQLLDPETGWTAGAPGGIVGEASEFEWSRVLTGRRSNGQTKGLSWTADPTPYLGRLSMFGPLPDTDVHD